MQFQVPQFETENKFIGDFTIAQVAYVSVSILVSFLLFPVFVFWFWFIISSVIVGGSVAVALVKVNGRPMHVFLTSAFYHFWEPRILISKPVSSVIEESFISDISTEPKDLSKQPSAVIKETIIEEISKEIPLSPKTSPSKTPDVIKPSLQNNIKPSVPLPDLPPVLVNAKEESFVSEKQIPVPSPVFNNEAKPTPDLQENFILVPVKIVKQKPRLQNLFNKITTSSSSILFREESLKQIPSKWQKNYEYIQKPTGETIAVRRIDYK